MSQDELERLFARYQRTGKPGLLGQVYDETSPGLWPLALQLTRDHARAEDLVQSVYLRAIERHAQWDGQVSLIEWLTGLLTEAHLEQDLPTVTLVPEETGSRIPSEVSNPVSKALAAELDNQLHEALAQLPAHYRVVLELKILEGRDSAEIGSRIGKSAGTVRSQIARGLERLRMLLPTSSALLLVWLERAEAGQALTPRARVRREVTSAGPPASALGSATYWVFAATALIVVGAIGWYQFASETPNEPLQASTRDSLHSEGTAEFQAPTSSTRETVRAPQTQNPSTEPEESIAQLTGRVLDDQGQPVAGAEVKLFSWKDWSPDWQPDPLPAPSRRRGWIERTDEGGRFAFAVPPPEKVEAILEIEAGDHFTRKSLWMGNPYSGVPALEAGSNALGTLRLSRAGVLEGEIRDAQGNLVPYAQLHVWPGQNYTSGSLTAADASGRVRLPKALPGWHSLMVTQGQLALPLDPIQVPTSGATPLQRWTLPETAPTTLVVQSAQGQPVADLRCFVEYAGPPRMRMPIVNKTNAAGRVELTLPVGSPLILEAPTGFGHPVRRQVTVSGSGEEILIALPESPSHFLHVVDARTRTPLEKAQVSWISPACSDSAAKTTRLRPQKGVAGSWPLPVMEDSYVRITADGYGPAILEAAQCQPVTEVALTPLIPRHGRVVQGGNPVGAARIEVSYRHGGTDLPQPIPQRRRSIHAGILTNCLQATADSSGAFSVPLETDDEGPFLVHAFGPDGGAQRWITDATALDWGEIELQPYADLRGSVRLPEGLNPAGLSVFLNTGRGSLRANLDEHGRFHLDRVPAGQHQVQMDNHALLHGRQILAELRLAPGEAIECELDARHLGKTGVSMRVLHADGRPAPGVAVALAPHDWQADQPGPEHLLGKTDRQGRCLSNALVKGPCRWWLKAPEADSWQLLPNGTVHLSMKPLARIDLTLP